MSHPDCKESFPVSREINRHDSEGEPRATVEEERAEVQIEVFLGTSVTDLLTKVKLDRVKQNRGQIRTCASEMLSFVVPTRACAGGPIHVALFKFSRLSAMV